MTTLTLKSGRDESLLRRHPWVFSGALRREDMDVGAAGETVDIAASDGRRLARGACSPASQIRVRTWTFALDEEIGPAFFADRLKRAIATRAAMNLIAPQFACRLVNAESDGLPGLIVDHYAGFLVCQFLFAGVERCKNEIVEQLQAAFPAAGIFERSETEARSREGLQPATGVLAGREPPALIEIREGDVRILADIRKGHKTGFYLDQRVNRAMLPEFCAGADVLNAFAYTGGFGLWALKGGAKSVVNVDTSAEALSLAQRNADLNGFPAAAAENVAHDAFQVLRRFREAKRQFDVVVLDPPKFAASAAQVMWASRGYKDINMLAFQLLKPGGFLFTFSCSGRIPPPLFQKIVADAALDAKRPASILRFLGQSPDHPVLLSFPEGHYLKGLICRVD
ncbi:MAG: class I SAM-dependent methyltransferase [Verrucomicrobiota bacterium]|nr:class I SAM-dependent methyltransferase [Verrucomicrobiota bacterium]